MPDDVRPDAPLPPGAGHGGVDLHAVVDEIYAEAARRRRSGEIPAGLERELDAAFAKVAPPAAVGDDLAAVIERVERASFIDVDVPTASNRPGVAPVKQVLRKSMAWYLRYVAQQVSGLGSAVTRGLSLVDAKLVALEEATPGADPRVRAELLAVPPAVVPPGFHPVLVEAAAAGPDGGRVLHTECGEGSLVLALLAAGVAAYGVDPRRELLGGAARRAADVRAEAALPHVRSLPDANLAGVVLSGVTDTAPVGVQVALADEVVRLVRPGGCVAVLVTDPSTWPPVVQDLAPGRPLQAATWEHLLTSRGCTVAGTHRADGATLVVARA